MMIPYAKKLHFRKNEFKKSSNTHELTHFQNKLLWDKMKLLSLFVFVNMNNDDLLLFYYFISIILICIIASFIL